MEVREYLTVLTPGSGFHPHSVTLKELVLEIVNETLDSDIAEKFVIGGTGETLPIPVYSSVTPNNPVTFLMHTILMLGQFDTELDFKHATSLKHCLSKAG